MSYDPLDIKDHARRKVDTAKSSEQGRLDFEDELRTVMGSVVGRRFMSRLLHMSGVYRSSFTGNSHTFYHEGMRKVGLDLSNHLHDICPDLYLTMVKESQIKEAANGDT